jgi:hypothetical protein
MEREKAAGPAAEGTVGASDPRSLGTAKQLANACTEKAKSLGIAIASVVKAAGGNLESFMLDQLNSAVDAEVDRVVAKDKS